jgi:ubiquinone/menaquinone biosynthesis C-methylase UbiE
MGLNWQPYISEHPIRDGTTVLDIGCGNGRYLFEAPGTVKVGVDLSSQAVLECSGRGLMALQGRAEHLPFAASSFDTVICKVVLPYTLEDVVIREINRVLASGGVCYLVGHGSGYFLRYLLLSTSLKKKIYGLRSLVNTWYWQLAGKRLPGFWGDSIYQSRARMQEYSRNFSLELTINDSKTFFGLPVFIYARLSKA